MAKNKKQEEYFAKLKVVYAEKQEQAKILKSQDDLLSELKKENDANPDADIIIPFGGIVDNLSIIAPEKSKQLIDVLYKMNKEAIEENNQAIENYKKIFG